MLKNPVTCEVRYRIDPCRISEFEAYAQIWVELIERHGGKHHGYFIPRDKPKEVGVSFPGVGQEGAADIAIALFTFPDEKAYCSTVSRCRKIPMEWPRTHVSARTHPSSATSAFS
jgi:hypothetical protein